MLCSLLSSLCLVSAVQSPFWVKMQNLIDPSFRSLVPEAQQITLQEIQKGASIPTNYVIRIRSEMNSKPWTALSMTSDVVDRMSVKTDTRHLAEIVLSQSLQACDLVEKEAPRPSRIGSLRSVERIMSETEQLRNEAIVKLTPEERRSVFVRAGEIVKEFGPQEEYSPSTEPMLKADRAFVDHAKLKIDWGKMKGSAMSLLRLADDHLLQSIVDSVKGRSPRPSQVPGVSGKVLLEKKTSAGWIIYGSREDNVYAVTESVALIVDLGGNDRYQGCVASSRDEQHGTSAIVDLGGDDYYEAEDTALATGRLGCALIVDRLGNDSYRCNIGGMGAGFAGIGMIIDEQGNDRYRGKRFGVGAGIVGAGIVLDIQGNDLYQCDTYGVGIGGPCATGLVHDSTGDDIYQSGFTLESAYTLDETPKAKPGNPAYQYDAWGIGMGIGRRVWPYNKQQYADVTLAGGFGCVLDRQGNDTYRASNFALACGYFFGIGCVVDERGDDQYFPARYGIASGAHYAMGLFIDKAGNDRYVSSGPIYNCGSSWDHSVFLFMDQEGNDFYDLRRSAGLGRADIGSLGIAIELKGNDRYLLNHQPGSNTQKALAGFVDAGGTDIYEVTGGLSKNDIEIKVGVGGVFSDRRK